MPRVYKPIPPDRRQREPQGAIRERVLTRLRAASPGERVSIGELVDVAYGHRPDGGPMNAANIVRMVIFAARQDGEPIRASFGPRAGYWLSPDERQPVYVTVLARLVAAYPEEVRNAALRDEASAAGGKRLSGSAVKLAVRALRRRGVPILSRPGGNTRPGAYRLADAW